MQLCDVINEGESEKECIFNETEVTRELNLLCSSKCGQQQIL